MECFDVVPEVRPQSELESVQEAILTDRELATLLQVTRDWVRSHSADIPGLIRFGMYYRFRRADIEEWLGSVEPVWNPAEVARLMKVPLSWIYANADAIPGVLRLGRYVRFRPALLRPFIGGSETCQ